MTDSVQKPKLVIVGGGAGGLELATRLGNSLGRKQLADITLVDTNPSHLWKPRLHEVAVGVLDSNVDELDYLAHAYQHNFSFVLGRMVGLDRAERKLTLGEQSDGTQLVLPERQLHYDTLILALGSQTNDFNTPGAAEHCVFLDQRKAAETFRHDFMNVYWHASALPKTANPEPLNIAIVGAGATGVELAAELNHAARELNKYGFDNIPADAVRITLIEASPRVMSSLTEKSSAAVLRQLQRLNIDVLTNEKVTQVTATGLSTESGKHIPAVLKVWSAGVKAPAMLSDLDGLESNRINQLVVNDRLQTTRDPHVFAFGDCAAYTPIGAQRPVPARAQTASQQARLLAKSLERSLCGKSLLSYRYHDRGSLISLSTKSSVGQLMGNLSGNFTFEGKMARLFYIMLYRLHQVVLHGYVKTGLLMIRDRINQRTGPTLKLH